MLSEKRLLPGLYQVSVLAENEDGDSPNHSGGLYRIHALTPPARDTLKAILNILYHWT